jgi:biotin operon repressor BirA-like protein
MAHTTSRILQLLNLLQTHRQWSGAQLAERLDVTRRTLRRDIDRLRELGYRVEATRGAGGGYRLEAGAELPPLLLTDEEAVTMAIGLRVAAAEGLTDGEQTTLSALAKFEQVLPSALRQRVNALAASVQASATVSRRAPVSPDLLGQLALCCRDRERVRFHYVAGDGAETDRVVEPHSLVTADHTWFLVCWDLHRVDWRTFRVDRMARLFGTRVHFAARDLPAADAAEFVAVEVSRATRGTHTAQVVMTLPINEMRSHFGPWAVGAVAADAEHTIWPIVGDEFVQLLSAVVWIPPGVDYEVRGSPEFLEFLRQAAERMMRAVTPA